MVYFKEPSNQSQQVIDLTAVVCDVFPNTFSIPARHMWRVNLQKQFKFLIIFKNLVFSFFIPFNLNKTAVGLLWLGKDN